jgi:acetyl esterase/lipase
MTTKGSLVYYRALKDAKIPVEMHLFATGGHGFGIHPTGSPEEHWTGLATAWLRSRVRGWRGARAGGRSAVQVPWFREGKWPKQK